MYEWVYGHLKMKIQKKALTMNKVIDTPAERASESHGGFN